MERFVDRHEVGLLEKQTLLICRFKDMHYIYVYVYVFIYMYVYKYIYEVWLLNFELKHIVGVNSSMNCSSCLSAGPQG